MKFTAFPFAQVDWEPEDLKALQDKAFECFKDKSVAVDVTVLHAWIEEQLKLAMKAAVAQTTDALNLKLARFEEQARRQQEEVNAKLKLIQEELDKFGVPKNP